MSSTTFIYRVMVPANLAWKSRYYIVMRTKNSKSVKQMLNLWSLSWAKLAVWLKLPLPNKKKIHWSSEIGQQSSHCGYGRWLQKKSFPEFGKVAVDFELWYLTNPSWSWSLAMFVYFPQNLSQIPPIFCSAESTELISCCAPSPVSV